MLVAAAAAVAAAAPLARADHEEGHEPLAPAPVDEGVHDHSSHDHGTGVQFEDGSWMVRAGGAHATPFLRDRCGLV